jgi:hypothetical protein
MQYKLFSASFGAYGRPEIIFYLTKKGVLLYRSYFKLKRSKQRRK